MSSNVPGMFKRQQNPADDLLGDGGWCSRKGYMMSGDSGAQKLLEDTKWYGSGFVHVCL